MKRLRSLLQGRLDGPMRRLEVSVSGRWYIALTIGIGVVGLVSQNNVLYLIESLMLSGLILSGVLSERTVSAAFVTIRRGAAIAGEPSPDLIEVTNRKSYPLFCVEVGEWHAGELVPLAFIPKIEAGAKTRFASSQVFTERGKIRWNGLYVATSYPFGFAKKSRLVESDGERIVWPRKHSSAADANDGAGDRTSRGRSGLDFAEGEVRPIAPEDDFRTIVWTASQKGAGPMVRVRRRQDSGAESRLDLRTEGGPAFEAQVIDAAKPFHSESFGMDSARLTLIDWTGNRRISGQKAALDQLALVQPGGKAPRSAK